MVPRGAIAGVVLAGGRSRRMFAGEPDPTSAAGAPCDKGLLALLGKPMIAHVVERLRPQVAMLVVNANGDAARFASLALPVVGDPIEGHAGPLAGVLAGLRWVERHAPGISHIATAACDVPFLPADVVSRLAAGLAAGSGAIAIARSPAGVHPTIGLWPVGIAGALEAALLGGERKMRRSIESQGAIEVDFMPQRLAGVDVDPFFNANTRQDFAAAETLLTAAALREHTPPAIGIAGWSGSGKTMLAARLIRLLKARGMRVAAVKHTHHDLERDDGGGDSRRLREAGAVRIALVTPRRTLIDGRMIDAGGPPQLAAVLYALQPCDLVVVEGYKHAPIPKIEVRRAIAEGQAPLAGADPMVIAIAADFPPADAPCPAFAADAIETIADFIEARIRPIGRGAQ